MISDRATENRKLTRNLFSTIICDLRNIRKAIVSLKVNTIFVHNGQVIFIMI